MDTLPGIFVQCTKRIPGIFKIVQTIHEGGLYAGDYGIGYEIANIIECWVVMLNKKHFNNFSDSRVVLVNNSREGDVGVIFMFVNSRVAFWVLKVFDSTDINAHSGLANVGYMGDWCNPCKKWRRLHGLYHGLLPWC